jgi:hypothetical protein
MVLMGEIGPFPMPGAIHPDSNLREGPGQIPGP